MTAEVTAALERVRPGDVLIVPGGKSGGRVAVLSTSRRRGGDIRVRAVTPDRRLVSLGPRDFPAPPSAVAQVGLPVPYAPHNAGIPAPGGVGADRRPPAHRRRAGSAARPGGGGRGEVATALATAAAAHPVAECPDARTHLRSLERADRLARDIDRLERRVKGRTESLARQFDRVLRVLEAWGYVDGWSLTEAGERLARLYHESDLLVAECAGQGLLDDLEPAELAGLVSVFTYEARGPGEPTPSVSHRQAAPALGGDRRAGGGAQRGRGGGRPAAHPPARPGFRRPGPRLGRGGAPGRRHRRRGDLGRRLRPQRQAAHRPAAPAARTWPAGRPPPKAAREGAQRLFRGVVAASSVLSG